ncbi:ATP-dependent RNA helicase dbp10 [Alternaria novae-zelandiae]|uniref:ATP-dependent RNA helicase dbp10 n=1 Tax=Alternaria novae-zelandiae TaxID=430562 RepID=UPI0020C3E369|nr:ATP-dependent RNA helicase dbp10 [Alternaria novae-zelandiae]XP_051290432.1 ATP-dependent RNA helicase dbp10 [Alternaria incomplexa]XP_051299364.1 ATP-dependent RNA helicase dbp10 [Alternaria arbusti]KAI4687600.1 ATP-dependent RNA helicase dbp10 [Alternaria novae-zelandiae]KAI4912619.1 ATP-dependent RNA helicase dbp10 [Alternaria incomplexa]KAI4946298.1 ATP-dependent RNA helicase dbp10 [Alternaria arbusti]
MAPRASSPALSETEFDIFDALAGGDDVQQEADLNADLGVDLDVGHDDGSDDEAFIAAKQAASNRKASNVGKSIKKGGGFQAMGLNAALLKAITQKGFKIPTPIQRKAVPLMLDGQDVVGMARTGSGKTAAFVIPMIQKLKAHSAKVGARGIIMSPSRELALQTLKVVKELGRGTDLRTILLVGGDSLEEQFSSMTTNPDIIIATPGRFLHLKVEMGLDLSSVKYIVFDEADRLFEMGFAAQLAEILHALPTSRQTLLFSATLPKSLVEFARAGLQEPKLIRLDAESKISPDLKSAYFTIKSGDRDGALLHLLDNVIKVPVGETDASKKAKADAEKAANSKKRKRSDGFVKDVPIAESTIIFAATKHRVEYLANLLRNAGYAVSYVYGNLDQTARKEQIQDFRTGLTRILVVTDVAARGVDMPHINHVINYDFPSQPKIFVHRVGRTARAGRKGWAYSLCRHVDLPYLIDLQLFLGKRLLVGRSHEEPNYAEDFVVGSLAPWQLESSVEIVNKQLADDEDLALLLSVAEKGERQYQRTRNQASAQSVGRAKELVASPNFAETHMLFSDDAHSAQKAKEDMLARIQSFRPAETVFEIGKRGTQSDTAEIMRKRREQVGRQKAKQAANKRAADDMDPLQAPARQSNGEEASEDEEDEVEVADGVYDSDSDGLEVSVSQPSSKKSKQDSWKNDDFFMSYTPKENMAEEKAYGVSGGDAGNTNFVSAARAAEMSLVNDEIQGFADAAKSKMRWDKKSKKYVNRTNDEDGSKGAKMIRGESGQKIAASFRSGRFDDWRKANKVKMPRVGEIEAPNRSAGSFNNAPRYKHKAEKAPKQADRYRDDYHVQKKRVAEAKEKRIGAWKDGGAKSELRDVDAVRKNRKVQENRRAKNARPSKKRKF